MLGGGAATSVSRRQNRSLIVASVFIAILLWLHIATDRMVETTMRWKPAIVGQRSDLVLLEAPTDYWSFVVRATGKDLVRRSNELAKLKVDISALGPGTHSFGAGINILQGDQDHIHVILAPGLAPQVSIPRNTAIEFRSLKTPTEIRFRLEKRERKTLEVIPEIDTGPISSLAQVEAIHVYPESIQVEGPSSEIEALSSSKTRAIRTSVTDGVIRLSTIDGPSQESRIDGKVANVEMRLKGVAIATEELPEHSHANPEYVTVAVEMSAIVEKTFYGLPIRFEHLPPGFEVRSDASTLDITLAGSQSAIENVDSTSLDPRVDLSPFRTGGVVTAAAEISITDERISLRRAAPPLLKITLTPHSPPASNESAADGHSSSPTILKPSNETGRK